MINEDMGAETMELMLRYLEGETSAEEVQRLNDRLRADEGLRRTFAELTRQHLHLYELSKDAPALPLESATSSPGRRIIAWPWIAGVAAAAAVAALVWRGPSENPAAGAVALTVEHTEDLVMASGSLSLKPGKLVRVDRLHLASGRLRFRLESGVQVALEGPADLLVLSPMSLRLAHGRLTALVNPEATGFTVDTPQAKVVDRGTRFGVDVSRSGASDVVVFQGRVEVHRPQGEGRPSLTNLSQGEAVRLDPEGELSRLSSITTGPREYDWSTRSEPHPGAVISSVTDNVGRERWSFKFYPILRGGLAEGVRAWPYDHNQPRWWSKDGQSLPDWLRGADMVQTLQQELNNRDLEVTVSVNHPATLYVFYEANAPIPAWLARDFEDTGVPLRLSPDPVIPGEAPRYEVDFRVWRHKGAVENSIRLGAVAKENVHTPPFYMYGIAAMPAQTPTEPSGSAAPDVSS